MKKRIIAIILLLALSAVAFSACARESEDFVDKVFIYEKLVSDGAFTIRINADGTFEYNEGSSINGTTVGIWTYSDGVICLTDNSNDDSVIQNRFQVGDNYLIYVSEGSSNFKNVTVKDGEKFIDITDN